MTNVSSIAVPAYTASTSLTAPSADVSVSEDVSVSGVSQNDVSRVENVPALEVSIIDPNAAAAFYAQAYDNRSAGADSTPRGVEIDRIEMIKQGFDHMRDMIQTISENAADGAASMDVKF